MRRLVIALFAAAVGSACKSAQTLPGPVPPPAATAAAKEAAHAEAQAGAGGIEVLATVDDTAVVALKGPGFDKLSKEDRLLAYWLSRAAREGDAIAWDQGYRHNLAVARLLRGMLSRPQALPEGLLPRLQLYARRLYLNRGMHDAATEGKLKAPFDAAELRQAALAAQAAGADLGLATSSLEPALRGLDGPIFDPALDPVRTSRAAGEDRLQTSAVNLYSGIARKDLIGLDERHPVNSRLAKEEGKVVEQVYRAGLPGSVGVLAIPPGLHAARLGRAAAALEKAATYAREGQRDSLLRLARSLRTGEAADLDAAQELSAPLTPAVDALIGFFGPHADPRGIKGVWLGLVGFQDPERTEALRKLAEAAGRFEARAPWPDEFKRKDARPPVVEALVLASAAGAARPEPFLGLQLAPARRGHASGKAVLLPGLDDAAAAARDVRATAELAPPELAADLVRCRGQLRFAAAALHEVIGHAAGAEGLLRSGEHTGTLEETRAELVAHFHLGDPKLTDLSPLVDQTCQPLWPQLAAIGWLSSLASVATGERLDSVELRSVQLQLWWFTQRKAVVQRKIGGKTFLDVPDAALFHKAAASLLSLLQTIQSTGDRALLRGLVDTHGSKLDPVLRDEIVARLDAVGIPRRVAALPPTLKAVVESGAVVDAVAEAVTDLDAQVLADWSDF